MKNEEIRDLSNRQLRQRIEDARQELFNLRFQVETRKTKNVSALRTTRRDIARLQTALRERQLIAEYTGEEFDEGDETGVAVATPEQPRRRGLFGLGRRK
ncbi:MAG TPA: 50S ribosomal protein L29 [Chloroflexia bacterium]|jgi:large subunit ribosomal protein L29